MFNHHHRHHHGHHHGKSPIVIPSPGFVMGHPAGAAIVIDDKHGTKITNPQAPFVATLSCGVHPGKKIVITGRTHFDHNKRFVVNLSCGPLIEDNIALHISIRNDEGVIVFNDKRNGHWGNEERHGRSVSCGMHIRLKIHAKHDCFKVKFMGHNVYTFRYRRPISEITHLHIDGGIRVQEVLIEKSKKHGHANAITTVTSVQPMVMPTHAMVPQAQGGYAYPPYSGANYVRFPPVSAPTYVQGSTGQPPYRYPPASGAVAVGFPPANQVPMGYPPASQFGAYPAMQAAQLSQKVEPTYSMTTSKIASAPPLPPTSIANASNAPGFAPSAGLPVPYIMAFQSGMTIGKHIRISGTPNFNAKEILITLRAGNDLAFHAIIDFNQACIIRNAHISGSWTLEDRHLATQFPFSRGQPFQILLICGYDGYKMNVNGIYTLQFAHRIPYGAVGSLEIRGDLTLANVEI